MIRLPVNSFFTEFKWLNNNIVQNPVRLDDKETNMKNTNIPEAQAVLVEEIPICVAIPIVPNVDFSSFEFIEHEHDNNE